MTRNRIHLAVAFSLLAHGLFALIPLRERMTQEGTVKVPTPMIVRLVESHLPDKAPAPEPVVTPPRVVRAKPVIPQPAIRPDVARPDPMPPSIPSEAPAVQRPAPQFDMLAAINARRQRREAFEDAMRRREEAHASPAMPGESDRVQAALTRNLSSLGTQGEPTGGVFTILSKGTRSGEFAFNGWRNESQRRWREVIEVYAPTGTDIEVAMVRRMIELIRTHYSGDFVWRSHRLGKSIVMSARPEHGPELERFLIREFFDTPTLAHKK